MEQNSDAWGKLKKDATKTDSEIVDPGDKVSCGAEDVVSNFSSEVGQSVKCIGDREKEQQVMEEAVRKKGSNCMLVKMIEILLQVKLEQDPEEVGCMPARLRTHCHLSINQVGDALSLMEWNSEALGKLEKDSELQADGLHFIELLVSKELRSHWHDNCNDHF